MTNIVIRIWRDFRVHMSLNILDVPRHRASGNGVPLAVRIAAVGQTELTAEVSGQGFGDEVGEG